MVALEGLKGLEKKLAYELFNFILERPEEGRVSSHRNHLRLFLLLGVMACVPLSAGAGSGGGSFADDALVSKAGGPVFKTMLEPGQELLEGEALVGEGRPDAMAQVFSASGTVEVRLYTADKQTLKRWHNHKAVEDWVWKGKLLKLSLKMTSDGRLLLLGKMGSGFKPENFTLWQASIKHPQANSTLAVDGNANLVVRAPADSGNYRDGQILWNSEPEDKEWP
jgi:hypothetical protein